MSSERADGDHVAPAIALAGRAMTSAMMSKLEARGFDHLTPAFTSIIAFVDPEGIRATVLAQRAGVSKQAMSQLMRLLIARGYVEQVADPTDTRAKLIRCTKRGAALRVACAEVRGELHALAVQELGAKNAERLRADLERLYAAFQDLAVPEHRPRRARSASKVSKK
jgi:DNA-binding MarR family transcriptional regulator